ncbi:MAG: tRNA (adenosine(37)-N6)-dimethylallyltransferase MiaA [Bacteriovoracaceae bacterium]
MNKNIVCVISGPTASGKTKTSLALRQRFGGDIVNFDSLLFYKELNIGTAKPDSSELAACPHHLIDIRSAKDPINAADYAQLALKTIQELHSKDSIVFLTGGSGFYLQALLYGMFDSTTVDPKTRERSEILYKDKGIAPFLEVLKKNDPNSFNHYHSNDHYRIRRAVEHFWTQGTKFSEEREKMLKTREENSNFRKLGWNIFHAHLDLPKEEHYKLIQARTQSMLKQGLVQEVKTLLEEGFSGKEKPMQSIGYKETVEHLLKGTAQEELLEKINVSTRQLAKAQRTWFKKIKKNEYNPLVNASKIVEDFDSFLNRVKINHDH